MHVHAIYTYEAGLRDDVGKHWDFVFEASTYAEFGICDICIMRGRGFGEVGLEGQVRR